LQAPPKKKKRFNQTINTRQKSRTKAWMTGTFMGVWQGVMMIGFEIYLIYQMVIAWSDGLITLGTIFAIQTFIWLVFSNLWELGRLFQDYSNALADAEEMTQILNQVPSLEDPKNPETPRIKAGAIEFKKVGFRYETEKNTPHIFKNFNLKIKAGEKVGLVGESGAGKSTFVNLLIRFMDTTEGEILIDGQNIKHITQDQLRQNLAYVPQEPILFHRSLKENIAYGKPEASQADIVAAAQAAYAHDFVLRFPEQYETLVGERGVKLSGGQKQRIAIARAMLKQAPVLILDEATSSLDSKAEVYIQQALEKLMNGKTTLVIAHRLSTLREMDRIIVFDQGKIVEDGAHKDLIKQKGKYSELWKHQSGGFIN
jgi:ATP-binding cassette subfamily B protein